MLITTVFFLGLIIALIGVIPPGLINMTAAKISLKEGPTRGIVFSIGACVIVFVQTYIATIFARYLSNHTEIIQILQRVAFIIFLLITIYYLFLAKKTVKVHKPKIRSKQSRFFQGIFLSSINVFPIPFQAYMTVTLASIHWLEFDTTSIISYVAGATMGSFVMFYMYIFFFDKIKNKRITSQQNMNYLIGAITGMIAIISLIGIIKDSYS